jgi:hypothetical protein
MSDIIPKFDVEKKGYLTYEEFISLVQSTGTKLTRSQIYGCIRGIDLDNDGTIDLKELEEAMKETSIMGVQGSPWKMYVDPAEDVLCYQNFSTGERIYDYQMKDAKLLEITIADMYGEADGQAIENVRRLKSEEWDLTIKTYFVKRFSIIIYVFYCFYSLLIEFNICFAFGGHDDGAKRKSGKLKRKKLKKEQLSKGNVLLL